VGHKDPAARRRPHNGIYPAASELTLSRRGASLTVELRKGKEMYGHRAK